MKFISIQIVASLLFVSASIAGNFPVQNYGNSFSNGFNQTQEFILRDRQIDQIERDRIYQQRMLKIEEERLEIERQNADLKRKQKEYDDKQKQDEWTAAVTIFYSNHPEYNNDDQLYKALLEELKTFKGQNSSTPELKLSLLEASHKKLQAKEAVKAKNMNTWKQFVARNPAFADTNSKQRKYGDYLFDIEYTKKLESGELTYAEALNAVAKETYKVVGNPAAPAPAPPVEAPLPEFSSDVLNNNLRQSF